MTHGDFFSKNRIGDPWIFFFGKGPMELNDLTFGRFQPWWLAVRKLINRIILSAVESMVWYVWMNWPLSWEMVLKILFCSHPLLWSKLESLVNKWVGWVLWVVVSWIRVWDFSVSGQVSPKWSSLFTPFSRPKSFSLEIFSSRTSHEINEVISCGLFNKLKGFSFLILVYV